MFGPNVEWDTVEMPVWVGKNGDRRTTETVELGLVVELVHQRVNASLGGEEREKKNHVDCGADFGLV